MTKINRTHFDTVIKILRNEQLLHEKELEGMPLKLKQKTKEISYCISFVQALYNDYEKDKTQLKLF